MPSPRVDELDTETPTTVHARFGLDVLDYDGPAGTATVSMPVAGLVNPLTGVQSVAPLAILLDAVGGISNHLRRPRDRWTVSSELALELSPDGIATMAASTERVVAHARPSGPMGATALAVCTMQCGDTVIGGGTVRSFYIPGVGEFPPRPADTLPKTPRPQLAELMSVQPAAADDGEVVLRQLVDPVLNNQIGIVHGGVSSAGLELAASAAVDAAGALHTASVRVNFLRPFLAGEQSRYVGTPLRIGRSTAVGDARAIGDDGRTALVGRITAYR
ncbi:PaaI family thioesterase [Mycobacterium sp. MYCO198283]|uniref:PaaI family thioesterase n=1 Tax=Mycobacterium sp. MYCO198283 TaxID=2883505 RepID=UPI001E625182|nr:PaaI family thioesterase [Mycobacterium sp. MYCO198283]MCG5432028.1 PaaI family thioesterase [Mycobacterium sp. MYCO198283]